jgi:hypothetical protein
MDVFCVGMYRSCSTWQYNICAELIERNAGGERLGFISGEFYVPQPTSSSTSPWRVLKAHDADERFAVALREGRARGVYSRRDLRDVVFSIMHKWSKSFDEVVAPNALLALCIANDSFWPSLPNVLCQSYESIALAPGLAIKELAAHLGFAISDAEANELTREFSHAKNQERAKALAAELAAGGVDLSNPVNALRFDSQTLLHWNHLRDGEVGGWRHAASPEQIEILNSLCGPWLTEHGYEIETASPA